MGKVIDMIKGKEFSIKRRYHEVGGCEYDIVEDLLICDDGVYVLKTRREHDVGRGVTKVRDVKIVDFYINAIYCYGVRCDSEDQAEKA